MHVARGRQKLVTKSVQAEEVVSEHLREAWVRRRPAWTRNDTARWLNERSALVLAWLRRTDPTRAPSYSQRMGRWLQEQRPTAFSVCHKNLSAAALARTDSETLDVLKILP
jgi:hypothetical protein